MPRILFKDQLVIALPTVTEFTDVTETEVNIVLSVVVDPSFFEVKMFLKSGNSVACQA
jgi:hypothetical protein